MNYFRRNNYQSTDNHILSTQLIYYFFTQVNTLDQKYFRKQRKTILKNYVAFFFILSQIYIKRVQFKRQGN